jgi:hypothetical protein
MWQVEQREALDQRLEELGLPKMLGYTPKLGITGTRSEEILDWLGDCLAPGLAV